MRQRVSRTPLGREEASLPSLSPQRGRSYSGGGGGGGVSNPPGIALLRGQDGAPLLSRRVGDARSPLQLRGRWSNLDCPLAAPPDGALVRPTGLPVLAHLSGSRSEGAASHAQCFPARGTAAEAMAVAPPCAARAPPLRGGVRRSAAPVRWNLEPWCTGLVV